MRSRFWTTTGLVLIFLTVTVWGSLGYSFENGPAGVPVAENGMRATDVDAEPGETDQADSGFSIGAIFAAGGPVGLVIGLLSIGAVALVIEHLMTIRASVLMPPGLSDEVRQLIVAGDLRGADQRCREQSGCLPFILSAGLSEIDGGMAAIEKAVEDAVADQSARLFRKIEYLSLIGNLAPMLGLLGTVIGMIFAFREVSATQGAARAADLAEGIYLALVTTVEGLLVAIPSLAAFALFRNRVDQLVADTAYAAQHALNPLKRHRQWGRTKE